MPTGCTPFSLVYGKACQLPREIEHKAYWALKQCNMDLTAALKNHFMELNKLIELRDNAYKNTQIYKERTKKWHDYRLRGDKDSSNYGVLGEYFQKASIQELKQRYFENYCSDNQYAWVSDEEPEAPEEASQSPEQASPSPEYVPGLEHPPSSDYVPSLEYSEYLVPFDDEVPIKDQPLPSDASPTTLSSGYVADFDLEEDLKEDPEEDPANYLADRGDDDDDEEEEEEHIAPTDSTTLHAIDHVPSAEDTEAFETDESVPTPPPLRSPQTRVPFFSDTSP
ncbi:hypothetical protein Tco_0302738 [Tanacetum coccineum]